MKDIVTYINEADEKLKVNSTFVLRNILYTVNKVEGKHAYVSDAKGNKKAFNYVALQDQGIVFTPPARKLPPAREKLVMNAASFMKTIRSAVGSMGPKYNIDHSQLYDVAQSLLLEPGMKEYLQKRRKDNDQWHYKLRRDSDYYEYLADEMANLL